MSKTLPARTPIPRSTPFFISALLCAIMIAGTYLLFVRTTTGQYIDERAWSEADPLTRRVGYLATQYLDWMPYLCAVGCFIVVVLITVARRRWGAATVALIGMILANVATRVIKVNLDRPHRGVVTLDFNSLPSGHTTLAASAAAAVFLVSSPRWRPLVGFIGATFAIGSGCALLLNQWHRPADVVAGLLVVSCFACLSGWVIVKLGPRWNSRPGSGRRFWAESRFWPTLCALLGAAAAIVAFAVITNLWQPETDYDLRYLVSGIALIVVSGYALCVAGVLLFNRSSRRGAAPRRRESPVRERVR